MTQETKRTAKALLYTLLTASLACYVHDHGLSPLLWLPLVLAYCYWCVRTAIEIFNPRE